MSKIKHLHDIYKFTNFRPEHSVKGIFGDPMALVICLRRRQKKHFVESVDKVVPRHTTKRAVMFEIWDPVIGVFIYGLKFVASIVASVSE